MFDIDGTLANYHEDFLAFAGRYFDTTFRVGYDGSVELAEWMGVSKHDYRQCKLAYRQGGGKRLMPLADPFSARAVQLISAMAEVWIATTRPYMRFDSTDPDTREWLRRHEIPYEGLVYEEDKYARVLDIVGPGRIVSVMEDLPVQWARALELDLNPLLIKRTHNQGVDLTRHTLLEAVNMTFERLELWHERQRP